MIGFHPYLLSKFSGACLSSTMTTKQIKQSRNTYQPKLAMQPLNLPTEPPTPHILTSTMRITLPPQPRVEKDAKLWQGQLYLSHTSEIVAKLLYKKFYRKTDVTILYGKWSTILRQQATMSAAPSGLSESATDISLLRYMIFLEI